MSGQTLFRSVRVQWRWLVDSPLLVATWATMAMGLLTMVQVARTLRSADRVRERSGQVLARVAAEAAIVRLDASGDEALPIEVRVGRVPVRVDRAGVDWLLTVPLPGGGAWRFSCPRLRGAAPLAFGRPLSLGDPTALRSFVGAPGEPTELPRLDAVALAHAWRADHIAAFRRDVGIALLNFEAGTELDDFVVDTKRPRLGLGAGVDLVVVPGHLWIESGKEPWRLWLEHDLTLVVQGNLYIGRPIEVDGPGRLVLATTPTRDAVAFADRDGNGRWSVGDRTCDGQPFRGAIEGGGNVYLGLAGGSGAPDVAAGLVVGGELHLRTSARIDGPIVLGHGLTRLGAPTAVLHPTGSKLFVPEREAVPGFVVSGPQRPGLLRPYTPNPASGEEPLYLAAPGR